MHLFCIEPILEESVQECNKAPRILIGEGSGYEYNRYWISRYPVTGWG
jgi:hypothetical protein